MPTKPATIDGLGVLTVHFDEKQSVKIDLYEVFKELSPEDRQRGAEAITWDYILDQAIRRLTDESPHWNEGGDVRLTWEVVRKLIDTATGPAPYFSNLWRVIGDVRDAARVKSSNEALYWKMFHDPINGTWFQRWLEDNKIKSQFDIDASTFCKSVEKTVAAAVKSVDDYLPLIAAAERISEKVAHYDDTQDDYVSFTRDDAEIVALRIALAKLKETSCTTASPLS